MGQHESRASSAKREGQRRRILIVDDEPTLRSVIADVLRDDYLTIEVGSAGEAVALLQGAAAVDLVISDIRMPGSMDGFGLARWLRNHRPDLPVILMTGYYSEDQAIEGDRPPILRKPFSFDRMLSLAADLMEKHAQVHHCPPHPCADQSCGTR